MTVFKYVAIVKYPHGDGVIPIEGRVESPNIKKAAEFLAADPTYYCVVIRGIDAGEKFDVRYLSSEARKDLTSYNYRNTIEELLTKEFKGLVFDLTRKQVTATPSLEVGSDGYWEPIAALTERGWLTIRCDGNLGIPLEEKLK